MRGGELVFIKDFAIRRRLAVESLSVPGSDAGFVVAVIFLGVIPIAGDFVRLTDFVGGLCGLRRPRLASAAAGGEKAEDRGQTTEDKKLALYISCPLSSVVRHLI